MANKTLVEELDARINEIMDEFKPKLEKLITDQIDETFEKLKTALKKGT